MATIRDFRSNLQAVFEQELGIDFVAGLLDGPLELTKPLGSCYVQRVQDVGGRVAEVQIFAIVRVFLPFTTRGSTSPKVPYDSSKLEDLAEVVMAVVAKNQTGLGPWFQRLTQISIDPRSQAVEAMIVAYDGNPQDYPREA